MQWNFSQALPSGSIGGRFLLLPVGIGHSGQGTLFVFHPGGHAAADVALRLVDVQHHPGLGRQGGIDVGEAVGDVFMFRRDELERFRPSPNLRANAGKYPHSHPYPLRFSG